MKKIKISFDFDGSIEHYFDGTENPNRDKVQNLFKEFHLRDDVDVHIITRRFDYENCSKGKGHEHKEVVEFAKSVNFPIEKIFFTNREYKFSKIRELSIDIHLDDEELEIHLINQWTTAKGVHLETPGWENHLEEIIKFHK